MQTVLSTAAQGSAQARGTTPAGPPAAGNAYTGYQIIRRNGAVVGFAPDWLVEASKHATTVGQSLVP